MSMTDTIADTLTRIRNASAARLADVECVHSKLNEKIIQLLVDEGYLSASEVVGTGAQKKIRVKMKYHQGAPVLQEITRISKPGRRVYMGYKDLKLHKAGLGLHVLTTPMGVLTDFEAKRQKVGGEVICRVY